MTPGLPADVVLRAPRYRHFYGLVHQYIGTGQIAAGSLNNPDSFQIDQDADFIERATGAEFSSLTGGELKAQFEIVPGELLQQFPMYVNSLGSGQLPKWWPQAGRLGGKRIPRGCIYKSTVDDRQAVATASTLRLAHYGFKAFATPIVGPMAYQSAEPFRYGVDYTTEGVGALGANATNPQPVNVGIDADFEIYKLIILCDGPGTIDIISSSAFGNHAWFNRTFSLALLGATEIDADPSAGEWPFRLADLAGPVWIPGGGAIQVTVADTSGATNRVQVILEGLKLKPAMGINIDPAVLAHALQLAA